MKTNTTQASKLPPEIVEKLRDISIHSILGIPYRRTMIKCPFHQDGTPSMCVYLDNGFHCFGCDKGGRGAIDFLMAGGMSFADACQELLDYTP